MNPRAAINDLHPFQGCPFSLLGTSAKKQSLLAYLILMCRFTLLKPLAQVVLISGEDGIRTHAPVKTNGFQDRPVMTASVPLHYSYALLSAGFILSPFPHKVNSFLKIFLIFLIKYIFYIIHTYAYSFSMCNTRLHILHIAQKKASLPSYLIRSIFSNVTMSSGVVTLILLYEPLHSLTLIPAKRSTTMASSVISLISAPPAAAFSISE